MQITLGQQYNVGEKPTVILYIYIHQLYEKLDTFAILFVGICSTTTVIISKGLGVF